VTTLRARGLTLRARVTALRASGLTLRVRGTTLHAFLLLTKSLCPSPDIA